MAKQIRRIVTGHNAAGKSIIAQDAAATSILELAAVPGLRATDLWETTTAPADLSSDTDPVARPVHLEPAPTGTIFRIVDFPPDAAINKHTDSREVFASLGASHAVDTSSTTPMMHKTASVDYAIVLAGEIWAVLDEGETRMKAGDVLIQRGTNHAWSNRSNEPAAVAFILVGAKPIS
jgi:mannose-6-phosphate isomerase-like protein (cupin superfamily)